MKKLLFALCLFLGNATLFAQNLQNNRSTPQPLIDSTELLIALLSKDSLVYRPEGDPLIISLIKQNNLRAMEFLLLNCHERPFIHIEGQFDYEDMQHYYARKQYVEHLILNYGDKWIFISAFSKFISKFDLSEDRLLGLSTIIYHFFDKPIYISIFSDMQRMSSSLTQKNISKFKSKLNF